MGVRDWRIFREDFEIQARASAQGGPAADPLRNSWTEAGLLPAYVLEAVDACGYAKPSPVQMQARLFDHHCRVDFGVLACIAQSRMLLCVACGKANSRSNARPTSA